MCLRCRHVRLCRPWAESHGGEEGPAHDSAPPRRARPRVGYWRCGSLRPSRPGVLVCCSFEAALRPLGCAERRESAKRSRHAEDVRRAGNTFTPLVLETHGGMGPGAEAWFRGCIAVAELQRPEWVEEDEEMGMEWERWARAQLSSDW